MQKLKYAKFAAKVVSIIIEELSKQIREGVSGKDLETLAVSIMKMNKVKSSSLNYNGFPASICVSVNDELTHGIPGETAFKNGDLVSIDVACSYKGYHADAAATFIVKDQDSSFFDYSEIEQKEQLLKITENALFTAISKIVPGKTTTSEVGSFIQSYVEKNGYFVIKEFGGHGIGRILHMDPFIPNFALNSVGEILKPGMLVCIEPLVQVGNDKIKISANGKTVVSKDGYLNAHFEHMVLIGNSDVEILTIFRNHV